MISWFRFDDIINDFSYDVGYDIICLWYILIMISWIQNYDIMVSIWWYHIWYCIWYMLWYITYIICLWYIIILISLFAMVWYQRNINLISFVHDIIWYHGHFDIIWYHGHFKTYDIIGNIIIIIYHKWYHTFPKPIDNVALNSRRPHRFELAIQLLLSTYSPSI
jgi:hypothetical protein